MPLYEYSCRACDVRFDRLVGMRDADHVSCPQCGAERARRLISVIGGVGGTASAPPAPSCGAGACGNC